MSDSYDFNATYGKLKVYDQVVDGPCWSYANALAIAASVKMHIGHEPTWPDDGLSYPKFDFVGWKTGDDWSAWENEHYETTIAGVKHTLKKEQSEWDGNAYNPNALKSHLESAGFLIVSSYIPRSLSDAKSVGINLPIVRGFADDSKSNVTHAYLGVGYTKDGMIVQNQWGVNWGNEGRAILSWPWIAKWAVGMDRLYIDSYPLLGATKPPQPPSWENDDMQILLAKRTESSPTFAILGGIRVWIWSRTVLPQQGLSMNDVKVIPGSDPIWTLPIVGKKPPADN